MGRGDEVTMPIIAGAGDWAEDSGRLEYYVGDDMGGTTWDNEEDARADYEFWIKAGVPNQNLMVRMVTEYEVLQEGLAE